MTKGWHSFRHDFMWRRRHFVAFFVSSRPQMTRAPRRQAFSEQGAGVVTDVVVATVVTPQRLRQRETYVSRQPFPVTDAPQILNECASHRSWVQGVLVTLGLVVFVR